MNRTASGGNNMKILGVTGGVGAGKSTVLSYLEKRYLARVIQADEVGKLLQEPGQECYHRIVEAFGTEILREDGRIDRNQLASIVFTDAEKLELLNSIVHPAVRSYIIGEIEKEKEKEAVPFCVVEAALLLEDRYDLICDEIWYIYAEESVRIDRLAANRGYSGEKSRQIMQNQLPDRVYRGKCDFVIDNSSNFVENTYEQIDKGLVEHGFL